MRPNRRTHKLQAAFCGFLCKLEHFRKWDPPMIRAPPPCSLGGPPPCSLGGGRGVRSRVPNAPLFCSGAFSALRRSSPAAAHCCFIVLPVQICTFSCFLEASITSESLCVQPCVFFSRSCSLGSLLHDLARSLVRFFAILPAVACYGTLLGFLARFWSVLLALACSVSIVVALVRTCRLSRTLLGNFALSWASLLALARCCHSCSLFCRSLSF